MSPRSKNGFLATVPMPQNSRAATFNEGAFFSGVDESLNTLTSFDIGMTTGSNQVVFSGFKVTTDSGDLTIDIFGESTFTAGSDITVYNTNKNSAKIPSIDALVLNPTVSVIGDLQAPPLNIFGDNNARSITDTLVDLPLILKPNTSYIFRITHNDTGTKNVSLLLSAFDNIIENSTF